MARPTHGVAAPSIKLEEQLTLLAWLNQRFGYKHNRDLLADMKQAAEGFDESGRSYLYYQLAARGDKVEIPAADLLRYDDNIRDHLRAMNAHRREPITLRYFQYLAVLYTEVFLDWYFHRRGELLRSLNRFVRGRSYASSDFSGPDLRKLAFWMATGSGKTLIMHLNYRQFLHYNDAPLDNILLITPNEGLSEQHVAEMVASNIPCSRFDLSESGLTMTGKDAVRVIEITKLVEQKRGGGVSVPVEAFEGNNLIFVDEGHKGSGGDAWRGFRERLSETGFTFEYSATFGQALTAARNDTLTAEYGKAIAFDYSYRYFYGDGYGKDFRILNLKEERTGEATETLLFGNLLSFYEQQRVFRDHADALRPYHLEKPLWVFVGGTVNIVHTEDRRKRSDVLTVARFLHHVLENRCGWAVDTIGKLMAGKTGLVTPDGRDVFRDQFEYLRARGLSPEHLYRDLLATVLHAPGGGGLHLCGIRGSVGEIGLKASGAGDYFGLIYIGDTAAFKKLVEADDSGIALEEDALAGSLFNGIGDPDTSIDVLIGAKKFMEGWNSWRVSNMGLLKVGSKEGSEIIQLFGRGVRLRGRESSLKRSAALDGRHPPHLGLLETLNIFSVRANYMAQFRRHLEKEGVEIEGNEELRLAIRPNKCFLGKGLVVPRVPEDRSFVEEEDLLLEPDSKIQVRVDVSLQMEAITSGDGVTSVAVQGGREVPIPRKSLDLVDWEKIWRELLDYKERKGFVNLAMRPETPRAIVAASEPRLYRLIADDSVVEPTSFAGAALLHEAVASILKKYVEKFYRARRERWDSERMVYVELDEKDSNFQDYIVRIPRGKPELIGAVRKLIEEADDIYRGDVRALPNIHFDRHLCQPLLIEDRDIWSDPPGLTDSERRFVEDLRRYCWSERRGCLAKREIYLLRNLSRGRGIGFFDGRGFYPDFILWIEQSSKQRIVFIEPHGMLHTTAYEHDEKARVHEELPGLTEAIAARSKRKNVTLDSFIVSATPYDILRNRYDDGSWSRERFRDAHIVFPERNGEYDYLTIMMG